MFFGPHLWLDARLEKSKVEPVTFTPPTLVATTPAPVPLLRDPAPLAPVSAAASKPLSNEELLKSIGFLPGGKTQEEKDDDVPLLNLGESEEPLTGNVSTTSSTSKLIETFEIIESNSVAAPLQDKVETTDSGDYVIVLPDCFDLDKPLSSLPASKTHPPEFSLTSVVVSPEALSRSSETVSATAIEDNFLAIGGATPNNVASGDKTGLTGSTSPSTSRSKGSPLTADRLTLRKIRGGLCRNPLIVASDVVNAVSDFVDEKVHFKAAPVEGYIDQDKTSNESSSDEEEFKVRHFLCMIMEQIVSGLKWK